jgi:hypothetical protein
MARSASSGKSSGGQKGGGSGSGGPSERDRLLKELRSLIKELDEEELRFLIRQSHTMNYNKKVDELNRSREEMQEQRREEHRQKAGSAPDGPSVFFEAGKRSSGYILEIDGVRSIMDEAEVYQLVRIAQGAASAKAAKERISRWFETNRDDVLMEVELKPRGKRMAALYERLRNDFAVRK